MLKSVVCAFALVACVTLSAQTNKAPAKALPKSVPAKPASSKYALDKATLEAYVRHQFLLPKDLEVKVGDSTPSDVPGMANVNIDLVNKGTVVQSVKFLVTKDGTRIIQGKVFDVRESPFAEDLKLLRTDTSSTLGPSDAKVTMFVFSDFQCQYCREEAKLLRQNLAGDYGTKVKLVFKDFPLEQIHPWAKSASMAGRCVARLDSGAFWKFHDWIFDKQATINQENLKTQILEFGKQNSLDTLQLSQCIESKLTSIEVEQSAAQARALQVNSTPTVFINGRRLVGNSSWEQLKTVIDYELDYALKNPSKDEACCEVKLPIPGVK